MSFLKYFHTFIPFDKPFDQLQKIIELYNKEEKGK